MSSLLRRIKMLVLLWIDARAMHMANRLNAVSSWCYYHAFLTKDEKMNMKKEDKTC